MTRTLIEVSVPKQQLQTKKRREALREAIINELNSSKRLFFKCEQIDCKTYPLAKAYISGVGDTHEFEFVEADAEFRAFVSLQTDPESVELSVEGDCKVVGTKRLMPHAEFDDIWHYLVFEPSLVSKVLRICHTSLTGSKEVAEHFDVSKLVLLHGPPGTGKSSLARAISQRLSIQLQANYQKIVLYEIDVGALVSKWASVSSKFISKLFNSCVRNDLESGCMVMMVLDEIDGLVEQKRTLINSEGIETVRIVNAVIRQLDVLKQFENVCVIATSNLPRKMDCAVSDRMGFRIKVDNPSFGAIKAILLMTVQELVRVNVVECSEDVDLRKVWEFDDVCKKCVGLSGRRIRNVATRTLERFPQSRFSVVEFAKAMSKVVVRARSDWLAAGDC